MEACRLFNSREASMRDVFVSLIHYFTLVLCCIGGDPRVDGLVFRHRRFDQVVHLMVRHSIIPTELLLICVIVNS